MGVKIMKKNVEVVAIDLNTGKISVFPSVREASTNLKIKAPNISRVINSPLRYRLDHFLFLKKLDYDCYSKYEIEELIQQTKNAISNRGKKRIPVIVKNMETNESLTFPSIKKTSDYTGIPMATLRYYLGKNRVYQFNEWEISKAETE